MTFNEWWEGLCISGLLVPSHPDKASAQLAWTHQQQRIVELEAERETMIYLVRELYYMACLCPSDAIPDGYDFYTPLEIAGALLREGEKG